MAEQDGNSPSELAKVQKVQKELDEAISVLGQTFDDVAERGESLDDLCDKTDGVASGAVLLRRGANRVRTDMWWKDMKGRFCIITGLLILFLVIIIPPIIITQ